MKFGCHISVAKGFYKACQQAQQLGAQSFQVFTKNPRSLRPKRLNLEDAERGRQFCHAHGLTLVTHTPYITNLSTPKADLHQWTVRSIQEDLQIADAFGAVGAVVHCGKHMGEGEAAGRERMVQTLNEILAESDTQAKLLLENTAGQGTELGLTVQELAAIREATDYKDNIGFCFDTCHGFAAGIWTEDRFAGFVQSMKECGYLDHLVTIHFNDSKTPFNSRKDRHQKIGQGEIGVAALRCFLQEAAFEGLPIVLETPVQDEMEYADEIVYLGQLQRNEDR